MSSLTRTTFTNAWLVWIALFFLIEGAAILTKVHGSTLSAHIRGWLRGQDTWVIVLAWVFMLALTAHFLLDLRRS